MKVSNKYLFFLQRIIKDLFKPNKFMLAQDMVSRDLGEYYLVFEENALIYQKGGQASLTFDEKGIPMIFTYIDVKDKDTAYYPITAGQYALAVYHTWLRTQSAEKKAHFLRIADWFMEQAVADEKLGVYWLTDVPKPEYKVFTPWKSAFSQSRGLSVLLRAWQISGNEAYLETATKALIPYTIDLRDGGVASWLKEGWPFYEEYTASSPTMVLDGHNFSLLGVMDYIRAVPADLDPAGHEMAQNIFRRGIDSLIHWLPQYDLGWWLRFNLCKMPHYPPIDPCTVNYFRLVLMQLELLRQISGREELDTFVQDFRKHDRIHNILRMYLVKYKALKQLKRL